MNPVRWIAVAIAILAALDPPITVSARMRQAVSVVGDAGAVRKALSRDYIVVDGLDSSAAAIVVVGDRYPASSIPERARVSTVSIPAAEGVRVTALSAPRAVPPGTVIHLEADVAGRRGLATELVASIGAAELARTSHKWTEATPWRASFDVAPVGEPPFVVGVRINGDAVPVANAVVDVAARLPVLFYDARPSWTTTFVRRALERDPRFSVADLGVASRGIAVRTAEAPQTLQTASLDGFRAVVVGGLDALQPGDVAALNRFMIERGGSVAVLPDARAGTDAARELVGAAAGREILLDKPAALVAAPPLPRIDASELLPFAAPPDAQVLAKKGDTPIVWTTGRGEGRLLVSGAMDAWRFRSATEFDRFWQSAIAGLALSVRPPLSIDVIAPEPSAADPRVRVRLRGADAQTSVSAALASGEAVRLWPGAQRGSFSGVLSPSRPGANRIDVVAESGGRTERASARFVAGAHVYAVEEPIVPLSLLSATHGGVDVRPDDLSRLGAWLQRTVAAKTAPVAVHPMRSPWWMIPFAGCLSIEWWIRRRRGFR